jgi:hypothetical protein
MIRIQLDGTWMLLSGWIGLGRTVQSRKRGWQERDGQKDSSLRWNPSVEGAMAEAAVAQYLDAFWSGARLGSIDKHDIGNVEVRSTHHRDGHMHIYARNDDACPFVFVVTDFGSLSCNIMGWIYARDAKRSEWIREGRPGGACYWVPQSALRPMEELRFILNEERYGKARDDWEAMRRAGLFRGNSRSVSLLQEAQEERRVQDTKGATSLLPH